MQPSTVKPSQESLQHSLLNPYHESMSELSDKLLQESLGELCMLQQTIFLLNHWGKFTTVITCIKFKTLSRIFAVAITRIIAESQIRIMLQIFAKAFARVIANYKSIMPFKPSHNPSQQTLQVSNLSLLDNLCRSHCKTHLRSVPLNLPKNLFAGAFAELVQVTTNNLLFQPSFEPLQHPVQIFYA